MLFILARIKLNHRKHSDVLFEWKLAIGDASHARFRHVFARTRKHESHADFTAG
jgi:hypothetical protein